VYGSITNNLDLKDDNNRKIYAGFKIASEFLIKNYCNKNSISLHICRIFNLYGKKNEFSIIEKLKNIKKSNNKVSIYNNGLSLRDYIHIDDIVKIYKNILSKKSGSNLYDVGTGRGICIKEIIEKKKISKENLIIKKKKVNEIFDSIADNRKWLIGNNKIKFKKIEDYLGIDSELKSKKKTNKNYIENNLIGSIIYGAGYSGKEIAKQMSSLDSKSISYFVDDDPKKIGKLINDIEIISHKKLREIAKNTNIRNIILAIPSLSLKKRSNLMRKVARYSETISTLPEKNFFKRNIMNYLEKKLLK